MTQRTSPQPAKQAAAYAYNVYNMVKWTVAAIVGTTINVAFQLADARGNNIAQIARGEFYLSSAADGHTLSPTATTSALAVATNGVILNIVTTGLIAQFITNALGQFDVNIIQTASPVAYYIATMIPDGSIAVSPIVQF